MTNVIPFPTQNNRHLHLFDDEEIFVTVAAINIYGAAERGIASASNLFNYEAEFVVYCVDLFKNSGLLSNRARVICSRIMERYKESS